MNGTIEAIRPSAAGRSFFLSHDTARNRLRGKKAGRMPGGSTSVEPAAGAPVERAAVLIRNRPDHVAPGGFAESMKGTIHSGRFRLSGN
jgi:hypothetical protein